MVKREEFSMKKTKEIKYLKKMKRTNKTRTFLKICYTKKKKRENSGT